MRIAAAAVALAAAGAVALPQPGSRLAGRTAQGTGIVLELAERGRAVQTVLVTLRADCGDGRRILLAHQALLGPYPVARDGSFETSVRRGRSRLFPAPDEIRVFGRFVARRRATGFALVRARRVEPVHGLTDFCHSGLVGWTARG